MDVKIAVELNTGPATGKLEFPFGLPGGSSLDLILHRSAASSEDSEKDFLLSYAYVNGKRVPVARRQRNTSISRAITVQAPRVNGQVACILKPCSSNQQCGIIKSEKVADSTVASRQAAAYGTLSATAVPGPKISQVSGNSTANYDVKIRTEAPIVDTATTAERQYRDRSKNAAREQEQCNLAEKKEPLEPTSSNGPRWIYKCEECQEEFDDEQKLEAHVNYEETDVEIDSECTERYAYICCKCYNQAATKQESIHHWERHFGGSRSSEDDDERAVDIIVMFRQANCKGSVIPPSKNMCCSRAFNAGSRLKNHTEQMHSGLDSSETSNVDNIKREALSNNGEEESRDDVAQQSGTQVVVRLVKREPNQDSHKCEICGKECSSKQRLESHRWTHTTNKPYRCDVCGASFVHKAHLVVHQYTHTGDWPYKCTRCPRGFVKQEQLTTHMKRSHNATYFACPICFNTYLHESNLEQHMTKKHGESAPYHCTVCKRAFFKKDPCTKHESRCAEQRGEGDSDRDVLFCTYCTAVFWTYEELCNHVAIHPEATVFGCDVCGKVSLHSGAHQQHVLSHKKKADEAESTARPIYSCMYCDRSFKSRKGMQAHVNFHTNTRPHGCDRCGASLSSASNLKAHMVSIHGEPGDDAKCPHCPKVFKLKRSLSIHVNATHHQKFEYQCELCNRKLASERKLQKHVALVHMKDAEGIGDSNPFPLLKLQHCSQCPFQTFSYTRMVRHRVGHSGVYPHQCSECSKQFVFKDQLTRHIRTVHRKGRLACPHCPRLFLADHFYRQHVEVHRSEQGHACTVCSRYYESQAGLEHHSQSHSQSLPFKCDICKKRFKFSQGLLVHRRFHHEDPSVGDHTWPHSCSTCRTRFKHKSSLAAHHLNKHSDSPRPTCGYCGRTFNSQCVLSLHIRTHTGDKPHVCEHCGKAFRISTNLRNHVITQHTKEFKMFCPLCGKGVVSNVKLKQHLVQSHKAVSGRKSARGEKMVEEQMLNFAAPLACAIVEDPEALLSHMTM